MMCGAAGGRKEPSRQMKQIEEKPQMKDSPGVGVLRGPDKRVICSMDTYQVSTFMSCPGWCAVWLWTGDSSSHLYGECELGGKHGRHKKGRPGL